MSLRSLLVERHDTETGGSGHQVQIPKQAFLDFFGSPGSIAVRVFDPPSESEPPATQASLTYYKDSDTYRINELTELGQLSHGCIILEESSKDGVDYDIWWLMEPDAAVLLARDYDWQQAKGNQYRPGRRWVILDGPGPRSAADADGLEDEASTDWSDYPIDTVLIRTETRTVYDVIRRITKGSFIMNPEFQRAFLWSIEQQSRLIESVLMRIPLPVFYLAEDDDGRLIVVDGLQRLSTFKRFMDDKLRLRLGARPDLHKKRFSDLKPKLQNRIEDCNLVLYIIDAKVPERARLDIFERVNGGVPLTRQQMRNCLYLGQATRFLKDEATTDIFLKATGWSLRTSTMRDREFVNRFCAFRILELDDYQGDMDEHLATALKKMNKLPSTVIEGLSQAFRRTLDNNYAVFAKHAFRKHVEGQDHRSVLNASIWDIMTVGLADYTQESVEKKSAAIRLQYFRLMEDADFVKSVTYGPNSTAQVKYRFAAVSAMLTEVFDADEA